MCLLHRFLNEEATVNDLKTMMAADFQEKVKDILVKREQQAQAMAAVEEAQAKLEATIKEATKLGIDCKMSTKGGKMTIVID